MGSPSQRAAAPRASLGATIVAAQFLGWLWPLLLLGGVEQVRIVPGLMATSAMEFGLLAVGLIRYARSTRALRGANGRSASLSTRRSRARG